MYRPQWNPPSPFRDVHLEWEVPPPPARLKVVVDHSKSVLRRNRDPSLGFDWSLNPYRGCTHACAYCYARQHHEYLDLGAGTDFERVILVKPEAPQLLEEALRRPGWRGELIAFSGVTDCYQALEHTWGLTRACLQVCARYRNPVSILTRSPLVVRDRELLAELASWGGVRVAFSIPILDRQLCRALEPGAPPPRVRLEAMAALHEAGVPVGLSLAPVIPGLNDHALPRTLAAAREAGASWAFMALLRLPGSVAAVFEDRLHARLPGRAEAVMRQLRRARGVPPGDPHLGQRTSGTGESWEATRRLFELHRARLGYGDCPPPPDPSPFRVPGRGRQASLFGSATDSPSPGEGAG